MPVLTAPDTSRGRGENTHASVLDYWSYYQLEQFIFYKAQMAGIAVEKVPAAYTTKSCPLCGAINQRDKHNYTCKRCSYRGHADYGASRNIGNSVGLSCPIELAFGNASRTGAFGCNG